jgi:two-component system, NarL family, invasion response regulator UvrY
MEPTMDFLIVDDHALIRRGVRQILEEEYPSCLVYEAASCEAAIPELRKKAWDLLIVDLSLPRMGGLELLDRMQTINTVVPVLVLSMHGESQFALHAVRAGARGYLTKDTASDQLRCAVQKILSGGRWVSETFAERLAARSGKLQNEPAHELLSPRELRVLTALASGYSVTEIARTLYLSVKTISTYRSRVLEKLQLGSNADLTRYCLDYKLVS